MKIFKYMPLVVLMICNNPLFAMKEQAAVAAEQEKKAVATVEELRKEQPKGGSGIKIFGSDQNPISLTLEANDKGEWYPTTNALTNLLNTYEPLKEYIPGMPEVVVEKSTGKGMRSVALFVAYGNANKTAEGGFIKGKPLFFLKISSDASPIPIPKNLDALQKGPVGRFGFKAFSNPELPIIVLQEMFFIYRGNDNKSYTIEVMHLAHGKSLLEIIDTHDQDDQKWAEKVGKALGLFHVEFMKYNNSKSPENWTTMVHRDFNLSNVFFDEKPSRVYFIDNGGMGTGIPYTDLRILYALAYPGFGPLKRNNVNFVLYFIKGYLSAYPLGKRESMVAYIREELSTKLEQECNYMLNPRKEFTENFIKQLHTIFTEACKQ